MAFLYRTLALFTDFGSMDSYQGEMKARLLTALPQWAVFDLMVGAPAMNPRAAAYLLAAIVNQLPEHILVIAVVDPGVGSERKPLLLDTGKHLLLGPDNGLLSQVLLQQGGRVFEIGWRPESLSASFHGRDLFAPAAIRLALDEPLGLKPLQSLDICGADWPCDYPVIIHIDAFGNLISGLLYHQNIRHIQVQGRLLMQARSFYEVPVGELFWYQNSLGLVEIAANQARACDLLQVQIGEPVLLCLDEP